MSKFKVGDIIRAVGFYYGITRDGAICEVTNVVGNGCYNVRLISAPQSVIDKSRKSLSQLIEDSLNWRVDGEHFEHARVIHNRLAEKLYPKGKRDGKWWVLC